MHLSGHNLAYMNIYLHIAYSLSLFLIGISGILINRRNIIIILMSIEVSLLSINYLFAIFSVVYDDVTGHIFALIVLTIAAAESAIGLAILVIVYTVRGTIAVEYLNLIKG